MNKVENKSVNEEFLECERFSVFAAMIAVGGFLGAYTFILKGGVFCNAQTANFVMLAINLGRGKWGKALYYLIPISAYLLGTVLSEFLPGRINRLGLVRWDTFFIAFEMAAFFIIGFIPDNAPVQISQVSINFIASMQYNTFRQARKIPMATTFCTNHLRQVGTNLVKWINHGSIGARNRLLMHFAMLASFVAGCVVATLLCLKFKGRAIWWAELLLLAVFVDFLRADFGSEKGRLNVVPHGH